MQRLRDIREQAGYSQQELANDSGVSQHTISEIELGRRKPQGRTLRKLAEALDVSVPVLVGVGRYPAATGQPETPPLMLARMMAEDDESARSRMLEGATQKGLQRYLSDIDRQVATAGREMEEESGLEGRLGWVRYIDHLLTLRHEAEPFASEATAQPRAQEMTLYANVG